MSASTETLDGWRQVQRRRSLGCSRLGRLFVTLGVALLFSSGCYRWVPIEANFAGGKPIRIGEARVGGESGQAVRDAHVAWPELAAIADNQPVRIDLRKTPAVRRELSPGRTVTAVLVPLLLGGLLVGLVATWAGSFAVPNPG